MTAKDLHVGQTVYVYYCGYDTRRAKKFDLKPTTIKSIGRKWFYLDEISHPLCYRFSIETGAIDGHGYVSEYRVILDPAEYYDAIDRSIVNEATRQIGALRNCSMDQIREIARILGIENKFCERKYKAKENA